MASQIHYTAAMSGSTKLGENFHHQHKLPLANLVKTIDR